MNLRAFKKEEGSAVEIVVSLMMFIIMLLIFLFAFRMRLIRGTSHDSETNLTSALLAGAIIDLDIYGMDHNIVVSDYNTSKDAFINSLEASFNIGSGSLPSSAGSVIISGITVHEYKVISVYDRNNNGVPDGVEIWTYTNDTVPAKPDDVVVQTTLYDSAKVVNHEYYDILTDLFGFSQDGSEKTNELLKSPGKMSESQWIAYRKFLGDYEDPLTGLPADDNWDMNPSSNTNSDEMSYVASSGNLLEKVLTDGLKTPNDVTVDTTTIYGDIGFWIGGVGWSDGENIFNMSDSKPDRYYVHVTKSVDIVNEELLDFRA